MLTCEECGATYVEEGDSCRARFDELLALDHSRREPWGSRHGLAFSAFVLQHADQYDGGIVERAWLFLQAVYVNGSGRADVARALRRGGKVTPDWKVHPLSSGGRPRSFDTTIADLGTFAEATYAPLLERWCEATLRGWSSER